jgi:hypothetical protein
MKKFSKIFDNFVSRKFYKATCTVELIVESTNEGEAGQLVDTDLGGLEYLSDFKILELNEISKDEYKEKSLQESTLTKQGITNESIMTSWYSKFGDRKPTQTQKLEFYHLLRMAGHSKESVLETLKGRL